MVKKKYKVQKQIDELKHKNQVIISDAHSTKNSEKFSHNILLEKQPISNNKINETTESNTLMEQKSFHDNTHNLKNTQDYILNKNEVKYMFQHKQCDTCNSSTKQTDTQFNKVLYLLEILSTMGQSIKEPKTILNLLKESRNENKMSSEYNIFYKNTINECNEMNTQQESSIKTILLSKECQNNITDVQSIKQELPTNIDLNVIEKNTYCQNESIYVQSDSHLQSMNSPEIIETMKQNIAHEIHECTSCCKKIDIKPFSYHNNSIFNITKNDVAQNTIDKDAIDKTSICDKNIMCILNDLDKCMDVLNRIGEHIMTVYAEKQQEVLGNQSTESSSKWIQNINSLTNAEKEELSKILKFRGKKDLLNVCRCQDINFLDKLYKSISQSEEYCSHEKNNILLENKSNSIDNYIKSKFEHPIKEENNENFEILKDKILKTNECKINTSIDNQICDISSIHDLKNTKELDRDIHWKAENSKVENLPQKSDAKSCSVDEFENIDILDSILNVHITIKDEQEIWENSQSPLMSPINYDNSNSVLDCIKDFFSPSEYMHSNETEEKYILSNTENSQTLLPEGSLGITGILNSLFDFDSPSNDFMYSNAQAINPRLIKKTFKDEISTKNSNISELNFEEKITEKNNLENTFLQENKELYNQNRYIDDSMDIVGFGLNTSAEKIIDSYSLSKSIPSFSDHSTVLVNSDNISSEDKESFPKYSLSSPTDKFNTDNFIEKSYIFQKKDINQVQLSDTKNQDLPEICITNNISSNMNYILSQSKDNIQSSQKYSCTELETSPFIKKQSLDSCDLLSSTDSISCNIDTTFQCVKQKHKNSMRQRNIQKTMQYNKEKQNHITKHKIKISTQSKLPKWTLNSKKKIKMKKKEKESCTSIIQPNQDELNLRCSEITIINPLNYQNVQNTCESPLSTFQMSYCQTSPKTCCTSKKKNKQLNCPEVKQMSQQKQILLNLYEDSMVDTIYKEDSKLENPQDIMEDISEDSSMSSISEKSHISKNKSCFKLSEKKMEIDTDIIKANLITDKNTTKVSNNNGKSNAKWSLQDIDMQPSNSIKEQIITTLNEDISLKKRKLQLQNFIQPTSTNGIVCSINQQKKKKNHCVSIKKKGNFILNILDNLFYFKNKLILILKFILFSM